MSKREANARTYNAGYRKGGYNGMYLRHYTKTSYFRAWSHIIDSGWLHPKDKILELGCGPGQFAHMLKDRGFKNYTGIDFSRVAINQARKRVPDWDFRNENIYDYKVTKEFDVVVALEVLEHIQSDLMVLKKMPQGKKFVFSVPSFNSKNHVRHFQKAEEVRSRYSCCCKIEKLNRISKPKAINCVWLFHGTFH